MDLTKLQRLQVIHKLFMSNSIIKVRLQFDSKLNRSLYEKHPETLICHFAFEETLTCKDMLAVICRRIQGSHNWLPVTYNLNAELAQFIAYWKQCEDKGLRNIWILKPWNLARSIDMSITTNLDQIIRSQETGPKVNPEFMKDDFFL